MEWNDANKDLRTSIIKKQREIDGLFLRYDVGLYNSDMNIPKKMKALALKGMLQNFRLREQVNDSRDENFHQRNYIYELQDSIDVLTLKLNGCAKTKSQREFIRLRDSTYGYIHCIESLYNFHTPNGIIHLCLMYYDEYEVLKIVITELNSTTVTSHTEQYIRTLSAQDIASKQLETNIASKQLECIQINGIRFVYSSMHHAIFRYDENTLSWINDITPLDKLKFKLMQHREQDSLSVCERKCLTPPYIKPEYAITKTNTRLSHDDTAQTYNSVLSWNIAVDLCLNVDDMDEKNNLGESKFTEYLNILIRLDNYYDLIIENFQLRYDLGIICQDAMVINRIRSLKMCNDEMKNRVDEINVKAAKLFQRTTLENFELTEMVIELNDESKYLKNEIDELRNKYTENSLLLNELIKVELIVDKKVKQMLENDKFNMKVKYYAKDDDNNELEQEIYNTDMNAYNNKMSDGNVDMNEVVANNTMHTYNNENYEMDEWKVDNVNDEMNGINEWMQQEQVENGNECNECLKLKDELMKAKSQNEYLQNMVDELLENQNKMKEEYEKQIHELMSGKQDK